MANTARRTSNGNGAINVIALGVMSRDRLVSAVAARIIREIYLSSTYRRKTEIMDIAKHKLRGMPGVTALAKDVFNEVKRQLNLRIKRARNKPNSEQKSLSRRYAKGELAPYDLRMYWTARANRILFGKTRKDNAIRQQGVALDTVNYFARTDNTLVVCGHITSSLSATLRSSSMMILDIKTSAVDLYYRHDIYVTKYDTFKQPSVIDSFLAGNYISHAIAAGQTVKVDLRNQKVFIDKSTICMRSSPYYICQVDKCNLVEAITEHLRQRKG